MNIEPGKLSVGHESVVIGHVSGEVGDGAVVIGPTDARGNVILSQPMAVGRDAFAGQDSIAIGARAGAGTNAQLPYLVNRLAAAVNATADPSVIAQFQELAAEMEKSLPDTQKATTILKVLRNVAALNGAWSLTDRMLECFRGT